MGANSSAFWLQRGAQGAQCGQQPVQHAVDGSHVHRGGEDVVGRLAEVDLVVGMHQSLHAALAAQQFGGAIGQHLVEVHVALRARAGLPYRQRKLLRMLAGQDLVRRLSYGLRLLCWQQTQVAVDHGAGALDLGQRQHDLLRHALGRDMEVFERALRLRSPQPFGGDLDGAEGIAFLSGCHDASFYEIALAKTNAAAAAVPPISRVLIALRQREVPM